jgi:hypothetical protein
MGDTAPRSDLPSYDELPRQAGLPASWGVWGPAGTDRFGCLNMLTPERIVAAAGLIQRGAVFALNWNMAFPDPPLFDRRPFRHEVVSRPSGTSQDDVLHDWNTQSSSQWDGFRHIKNHAAEQAGLGTGHYGAVPNGEHGIDYWARRGIVGRAVLADIGRWRASVGRPLRYDEPDPIDAAELVACLAAQGTEPAEGDILLMRTGWTAWYEAQPAEVRAGLADRSVLKTPGLRPGEEMARTLWNLHIAAIAADNPAVEVWPPGALVSDELAAEVRADATRMHEIFGHTLVLPMLGLPLGEMWDLEALAADCAADGRYECFLTSAPINLPAGVASPPNALAIK